MNVPIPSRNEEIPEDLLRAIRTRSNRSEESRFPYKVWQLLNWAGKDDRRGEICGCGWVSDTEFFIKKQTICDVLQVKMNTLNVNLRTLGFEQTRSKDGEKTFWRNEAFSIDANTKSFAKVRNIRCRPEVLANLSLQAVYLPVLEPLQLYSMSDQDVNIFKKTVVDEWESMIGSNLIFAVAMSHFINVLIHRLESWKQQHGANEKYIIQQVLAPRMPNVVDIFDFAVFLARFGPVCSLYDKLHQYQAIINDTARNDAYRYSVPSLTSYFSGTFHNCFRFQLPPTGEYHCYNLPLAESNAQFLTDEDGMMYPSFKAVFQQNPFLTQNHM